MGYASGDGVRQQFTQKERDVETGLDYFLASVGTCRGQVKIGGKTIEEATTVITRLFDDGYLVNPQVSITVLEYAKRRFTVLGQVQRPGTYEMPGEESINLLQAISMAGGYTRIGAPWKITLQRTVNDEQRVFKLDAEAMSKDRNAKPFEIMPDDTITVGEKLI
jgi:polysaccharide export outer membrane protein